VDIGPIADPDPDEAKRPWMENVTGDGIVQIWHGEDRALVRVFQSVDGAALDGVPERGAVERILRHQAIRIRPNRSTYRIHQ